ncbi:hypothetical protein C482_14824 [Natrialba chahannaoensis JCM 10990]|uniref:Uncharacterized protein n=1 Tax=Natrialba chahannaoensis JCM 10990 TaxID=1227492 RepID=M0AEU9_9EURY|nr:hypothetical protein [Natrialba chahannaoensis]ELY96931.1 hypothetical protein C482_14824 [Natrialba chahannaoensis JCM 10990]
MRANVRKLYAVARADFLQRIRSRRFVAVLAVIAYIGYVVNTGQIEFAYQVEDGDTFVNYYGEPTANVIGIKAGLTGSVVLLFGGFFLLKNTLGRDRLHDIDRLLASTPISDRTYLFGKWLSNVAVVSVILATLGFVAIAYHLLNGVGTTDPIALLFPLFLLALPVGAFVGSVALVFETVDRLDGTLGNICYFFLAVMVLAGILPAGESLPEDIPRWITALDLIGLLAVYEVTATAAVNEIPGYSGGVPALGTFGGDEAFAMSIESWPLWVYLQRLGLFAALIGLVLAAAIPFDRIGSSEGTSSTVQTGLTATLSSANAVMSRGRESKTNGGTDVTVREAVTDPDSGTASDADIASLTSVETRDSSSFGRLVTAELRLALRGQRWWWYAGALGFVVAPLFTLATSSASDVPVDTLRNVVLPLAYVWPIFVWSAMGVRPSRHRMTALVWSSRRPVGQLFSEWIAGVLVGVGIGSGLFVTFFAAGETALALGFVSATLFAPSLAIAAGIWSRTSRVFELTYLLLWYLGPLNGGVLIDFIGVTTGSLEQGVPIAFIGASVVLLGAAIVRRKREIR